MRQVGRQILMNVCLGCLFLVGCNMISKPPAFRSEPVQPVNFMMPAHKTVHAREGQTIVIVYQVSIVEGGLDVFVYPSHEQTRHFFHMILEGNKIGEFRVPVPATGDYRLDLRGENYTGLYEVSVNII